MSAKEPSVETIAKIILDEANLTFCETAERKDSPGERTAESSVWDEGKMDGEFDQEDYDRILDLQLRAAKICDERPELEEKTAGMFQGITADNAAEVLEQIKEQPDILELARIAVTIFILRFPTVQSFVNKGHPLVLATDEYMLENSSAQNWHDYKFIAQEFGWEQP
ncbi:hypothetical protein UZ36_07430 [Candidatus Nitromaritima sp. SCGC AAA799-C22]|nr:hypothetical protein UZ36_07430 [Candidatus Nitromaritima sp. SCGC AAA799-C22]